MTLERVRVRTAKCRVNDEWEGEWRQRKGNKGEEGLQIPIPEHLACSCTTWGIYRTCCERVLTRVRTNLAIDLRSFCTTNGERNLIKYSPVQSWKTVLLESLVWECGHKVRGGVRGKRSGELMGELWMWREGRGSGWWDDERLKTGGHEKG